MKFDSLAWELGCKIKNYAAIKTQQFFVLQMCVSMGDYANIRGFMETPECAELMCSENEIFLLY